MPLPSPSGKEKRTDFISRCISSLSDKGEGKGTSQRVAICNSQWRKAKAMIVKLTPDEIKVINQLMAADHSGNTREKKKKKKMPLIGTFDYGTDANGFAILKVNL